MFTYERNYPYLKDKEIVAQRNKCPSQGFSVNMEPGTKIPETEAWES